MKALTLILTVLGLLYFATAALPAATTDDRASSLLANVGPGTLESPVGSEKSGVEIRASQDSSKASVKLGQAISGGNTFSTIAVTASAPISKTDDTTSLATLDGFANAFTLEFKLSQFLVHRNEQPDWKQHESFYDKLQDDIANGAVAAGDAKTLDDAKKMDVDENNIRKYAPNDYPSYDEIMWDPNSSDYMWGLTGTIGYQDYTYLTLPSLASHSANKIPYGLGAFWGIIPSHSSTLVTFSFQYENASKDATTEGIVAPPDANGVRQVKTGPIGPPVNNDKKLASIELRRFVKLFGLGKPIGFDLKTTYDFQAKSFGVDMPLSIVRDDKGNLTGGIELGWEEKSRKFTIGVIVGSAFNIF